MSGEKSGFIRGACEKDRTEEGKVNDMPEKVNEGQEATEIPDGMMVGENRYEVLQFKNPEEYRLGDLMKRIENVQDIRNIQGNQGSCLIDDPYMRGLYNGLEMAVSCLYCVEPQFMDAPEVKLP